MFYFRCSIDFLSKRSFEELETEISQRYLAGIRFIPADRRDAREFTRADFAEHAFFNHDLDLIWDGDYKHFGFNLLEGVLWNWFPEPNSRSNWRHGSLERCLGVLLRQIDGVYDIRINPHTAGPTFDMWRTRVSFISRLTVQEVGALLARELFCGMRFIPTDGEAMRDAKEFETEGELLGHRIRLRNTSCGLKELTICPSPSFLNLLSPEETAILRGIDIQDWVKAPFRNHPWIRPSAYEDPLDSINAGFDIASSPGDHSDDEES